MGYRFERGCFARGGLEKKKMHLKSYTGGSCPVSGICIFIRDQFIDFGYIHINLYAGLFWNTQYRNIRHTLFLSVYYQIFLKIS